jgi:hypothetical protein
LPFLGTRYAPVLAVLVFSMAHLARSKVKQLIGSKAIPKQAGTIRMEQIRFHVAYLFR